LVEQIEKGDFDSNETRSILEKALKPMLDNDIDTVVLGCTHYPFVIPLIKDIVGNKIKIIDPTNAVVKRVLSLIEENDLKNNSGIIGEVEIFTSGDRENIENIIPKLFKNNLKINKITWENDLK
jgi:glutamate racemase